MPLGDFVEIFRRLRVNRGSPHKPVMLLAVIQMFEEEKIVENKILYDQELLDAYRALFEVVRKPSDHAHPYFPFFHLSNDGGRARFWFLNAIPGREAALAALTTARSRAQIEENIDHVTLSPELFLLFTDPISRSILRSEIIERWFPLLRPAIEAKVKQEYEITRYAAALRDRAEAGYAVAPGGGPVPRETRDRAFSRVVRDAYDSRCAASGWRIILPDGAPMVEAAHLIPFAEGQDDDPRNGVALTPTFHWALDRFLIAPGPDLKWHVSPLLDSRIRDNADLLAYNGKEILLPRNKKYWPKAEALEWRMVHLLRNSQA